MKQVFALLLLTSYFSCFAQSQIKSGSTGYIEPMNGYETYLAAAFAKKHVPLIVVTDEHKAEYWVESAVNRVQPSNPSIVFNNQNSNVDNRSKNRTGFPMRRGYGSLGSTGASISVVDPYSSRVLFA